MINARLLLLLAALTAALLALAAVLRTNEPGDPFGDYGHVSDVEH